MIGRLTTLIDERAGFHPERMTDVFCELMEEHPEVTLWGALAETAGAGADKIEWIARGVSGKQVEVYGALDNLDGEA